MRESTKLFKLFGIDVQIHFSWWFIFVLLSWSLASSFFPTFFPGHSQKIYWFMGIMAALLLFVSVVLHELSHSLVAKAKGIKVENITLFFFGGVAGITTEDLDSFSEFMMALAGPLFSLLLGGIFYVIYLFDGNSIITAITFYLYQINLILAIFNLIPGFPLDGGRAFRALLYGYLKDLRKATYIATVAGRIFAAFLMLLGGYSIFTGLGNGLWFILLGGFLYFIAGVSYEQVVIKQALQHIPLRTLVVKSLPTIPGSWQFQYFLERGVKAESDAFLIKNGKELRVLDLRQLEEQPELNLKATVLSLAQPLSRVKTLALTDTAFTAYQLFLREKERGILPVLRQGKVLGFVTRKAVMRQLAWGLKEPKKT